jgi:hypothetical protein
MITVEFTAKRNLTGAHAVGDSVTLSFSAQEPFTPTRNVSRTVQTSLSGARETIYNNGLWSFDVTTEPVSGATLETLLEFLQSVEDGETFDFSPWEMPGGNPDPLPSRWVGQPLNCQLDSDSFSLQPIANQGTGGSEDWYVASFTVIESP